MEGIVRGLELAFDVKCDYEHRFGYDSLVNDPAMAAICRTACSEVFGPENVITPQPAMGSEDFAVFAQHIPAFFYWLGSGFPDRENAGWHSPKFRTDDDALAIDAALLARSALEGLAWEG